MENNQEISDNQNNATWDGKSYGNPIGYKMFALCIRVLGIRTAYAILVFVALYYYIFRLKSRKSSYLFQKAYHSWKGCAKPLPKFFVYRRIYRFGQILLDRLAIFAFRNIYGPSWKSPFHLVHKGFENLREIAQTGGVLLGAHIGNWEAGLSLLKMELDVCPAVAMMTVSGDTMQERLKAGSSDYLTIIPLSAEDNDKNMFLLKNQLEMGKILAIHGDRSFGNMRTTLVDFLGRPASFPIGPYVLAATLEKKICFVSVAKTSVNSYEVVCTKGKEYRWDRSRNKEDQIREWVKEYVSFLEEQIKTYPEQWFNFYDFWEMKN